MYQGFQRVCLRVLSCPCAAAAAHRGVVRINKAYGYAVLEDLDKIFPDLLDVFISITASDCKTRHIALLLLQVAGFCDNEDACSNEIPHC